MLREHRVHTDASQSRRFLHQVTNADQFDVGGLFDRIDPDVSASLAAIFLAPLAFLEILPIVADFGSTFSGLCAAGYRHQAIQCFEAARRRSTNSTQ